MSELHRVGEEIEQDLFDLRSVGVKREVARRQLDLERELPFLYERLDLLRDLGHNVAKPHVVEMQRHPAGLDLREVENVVDQREQMLSCALNPVKTLFLPRREVTVNTVEHQRRITDECVDRCPQLVGHARREFGLEPVRLLQLARLPLESRVLLGEIRGRGLNTVLELDGKRLELLV